MEIKELEMIELLKRIVPEIEIKIISAIKENNTIGNKYNRSKFYEEAREGGEQSDFPITISSYDNYRKLANDKQYANFISDMNLTNFYKICQYTNVSADYYLGFIKTKRKEPSAPRVQKDFGISDKAMDILSKINNHKAEEKGELSADIVNYILEDKAFWEELNTKLPAYIAALIYNRDDTNTDATRYGTMKVFERLLDNISEKCINSDLPSAKVDQLAPFQFDII